MRAGLPDGVDFRLWGHSEIAAGNDAGNDSAVQVAVTHGVGFLRSHEVRARCHPQLRVGGHAGINNCDFYPGPRGKGMQARAVLRILR